MSKLWKLLPLLLQVLEAGVEEEEVEEIEIVVEILKVMSRKKSEDVNKGRGQIQN